MRCVPRRTAARQVMTVPDFSAAATASGLCAACGMCCNGVLFDIVRLQPGEAPKAFAALGLKVKRKLGESFFVQPCAAHRDSCCTIYPMRPERCRVFACQQLQRVAAGESSEAVAREKIAEALRRIAAVIALLDELGGTNENRALSKRCEQAMSDPIGETPSAATTEIRARLARAKLKLDAQLDRDFRVEPAPGS